MTFELLLVDDSVEIFQMVRQALPRYVEVRWAADLKSARRLLDTEHIEFVLLDLGLPDGCGVELCTELQNQRPHIPIFLLTANKETSSKIMAFAAGADDYIEKPFDSIELRARVLAKLAKLQGGLQETLRLGPIEINRRRQTLTNSETRQSQDLTRLEYDILLLLASHPGEIVSRDEILDYAWGEDINVYPRSVDVHVSKIRKKLDGAAKIESVRSRGYRLCLLERNQAAI